MHHKSVSQRAREFTGKDLHVGRVYISWCSVYLLVLSHFTAAALYLATVKPPEEDSLGAKYNQAILSLIERWSSLKSSLPKRNYYFNIECPCIIHCPFLEESYRRGSTALQND